MTEYVDMLIVGAGLSGIAAAYYLQEQCPHKTYLILEARETMGGTWDLFRYPGVRSDSDMFTLGYSFRPWTQERAITDGASILQYLYDTARDYGIDGHIRYQHRVQTASWSSETARWRLSVAVGKAGDIVEFECNFLYMATGYYDYDAGYTPDWPGMARYQGCLVHPQHWPADLDYTDKQVVVIGSGATAVTLVPAMADNAAHVTMLQRTPTYIVSHPAADAMATRLARVLPARIASRLARWNSILYQTITFSLSRRFPEYFKDLITQGVRDELGPDYDVEKDFTPPYNPWDERLCLVPDSDLFNAIKSGQASIVTDTIETFTETGLRLSSGQALDADIIITATGLVIKLAGGVQIDVDGEPVHTNDLVSYKGVMYSNLPNLAQAFGYANASWTLKIELISKYVCRLLNYMDKHGYVQCTPQLPDPAQAETPAVHLTSGYIQRASHIMPKQTGNAPWRMHNNYLKDVLLIGYSRLDDGQMRFRKASKAGAAAN